MLSVGMPTSTFRYAELRFGELEIKGWIEIGAGSSDGDKNNKQWVKHCPIKSCGSSDGGKNNKQWVKLCPIKSCGS